MEGNAENKQSALFYLTYRMQIQEKTYFKNTTQTTAYLNKNFFSLNRIYND